MGFNPVILSIYITSCYIINHEVNILQDNSFIKHNYGIYKIKSKVENGKILERS